MTELSAGQRLRAGLDESLRRAIVEQGPLVWDEADLLHAELAAIAADRAERLRARLDQEFNGRAGADALCKLSAEARMNEQAAANLAAKVNVGVDPAKSPRHQRAANARWNRQRPIA